MNANASKSPTKIKTGVYRYRGFLIRACYPQAYCGGSDRPVAWVIKGLSGEARFTTLREACAGVDSRQARPL